jgi:outer membrane protein assembly factor BamD (BamD/ComL family)
VEVKTERETYHATALVITPGAWAGHLLADLDVPFVVKRKPVFWFRATDRALARESGCPVYLFETPAGVFYGFPTLPGTDALKVAEHTGGHAVADPLTVDRKLDLEDRRRVAAFLSEHLRGTSPEVVRHSVCLYTMSPDEHFVVDRHPAHPQVVFTCGLSGHGFKFTSVLGETMAALASGESSPSPIEFLSLARLRPAAPPPADAPASALEGGTSVTDRKSDDIAAKKLLDDGLAQYRKGDMREAVSRLLEVVARYPQSDVADNAHYNLGMIYEKLGLLEKAHNEYESVVLFYPDSDAASFARDRLEALLENADPAAGLFRQAQELYRRGRFGDAIHHYEELITRFPQSVLVDNAILGLGMLHRYHGDPERAAELFRMLRERFPHSDAARLLERH